MNKGEKRLFSQQSKSLTGKKAYLKLYRLILKRKELGDNQTMKALGLERNPQAYYNLRNYLLRNILKSLIHTYDGPDGEIARKIIYVKILFSKGITTQATKLIYKLLDQLQVEERFCYSLELTRLLLSGQYNTGDQQQRNEIKTLRRDELVKLLNWVEYEDLFDDFQTHITAFSTVFGVDEITRMDRIRGNRLFQSAEFAICSRSLRCYWEMHYVSAMMDGDFRAALNCCEELIDLFEANDFLQTDHCDEFISIQINRGRLQLALGETQKCVATLNHLWKISEDVTPQIKMLELAYAVKMGDQITGIFILSELEAITQDELKENLKIELIYEMASAFQAFGYPAKALKYINSLNTIISTKSRIDLQWAVRLLHLVIAIDLEDWRLVEWCYRNAYRFQYCRDLSLGYSTQFLFALSRICHRPLLEKYDLLEKEIDRLETLIQDQAQAKTLIYFDGVTWLKGKRKGKAIWEMNREQTTSGGL